MKKLTKLEKSVLSDALMEEEERLAEEAGQEDPSGDFSARLEALLSLTEKLDTIEVE